MKKLQLPCESATLEYGDFALEGNGPNGRIAIGIERKTLHDLLSCIDDSRYAAHQRPGMMRMYDKSFLILEGCWKPHEEGFLMEGFRAGQSWGFCKYRTQRVMYAKLRRYLFSISLSGVVVIYSRDPFQTAYDIGELYHYFSKKWENHTSLLSVQQLAIPDVRGTIPLVRKWAAQVTDVGVKLSLEAEKLFKTPFKLANAAEEEWLQLPRVGVKTARQIVKEIRNWK
jgi:ERCC4-type nuclease